jgi:hypothetical protein
LPDIATNDGSTVETIHYNNCDNNAEVLHYKITGGGHTWAGMQNPYPEFFVGKNNRDIFASQEIWLFFKQHSLDAVTGIAETNNMLYNSFKIFPNPVADILNIESETNAIITIADISGKTLLHSNAVAGNNPLNIASLPSGIYVGTIQQQQSYYRFKVVKE